MNNIPTKEWLEQYHQIKHLLVSPTDLNEYFSKEEIHGKRIHLLELGSVPSGKILVRDPLVFLRRSEQPYFTEVPKGIFPLTIAVVEIEKHHYRYAAARLKFTEQKAVSHTEALIGFENLDNLNEGDFFGFGVDAGLATIVDELTKEAYCNFAEKWHKENPNGNIYDDFFAGEFAKSYQNQPDFQRGGGDWINFKIPGTELSVPMFQSGFGDGQYPVYFGLDEQGNICDLVIQFIDIELAFEE